MMKIYSLMFVTALVACGPKAKKEETTVKPDTTTDTTKPDDATTKADATPCAQEVALECPDGQIDGCLKQPAEGTTHACVAK